MFCAGLAVFIAGTAWWALRSVDSEQGGYEEKFVGGVDDVKAAKIVKVELSGEIGPPAASPVNDLLGGALGGGDTSGTDNFNAIRDRIQLATEDKDVKGLYLVVDTPGGDLTDSDLLWHDLQLFHSSQEGRFIFVHALAQCCSGGYYVASAADFIMVVPTSEVGSIGVMADYGYNAAELAKRFGVSSVVVSTGVNKDTLNPLKPVDARQVAIEQKLLDSQFERFVKIVAEGRKMPLEKARTLADGRAYSAQDALENGLVDAIGYGEDALDKLIGMAGREVCVVAYDASVPSKMALLKELLRGKPHAKRAPACRRRGMPVPRLRLIR